MPLKTFTNSSTETIRHGERLDGLHTVKQAAHQVRARNAESNPHSANPANA
jgi:hypothetical protein